MLGLRLQAIVGELQLLDLASADCDSQNILNIAKEYLPKRYHNATKKRYDLGDIFVLWEMIGIDAITLIENNNGELIRVGISLVNNEYKAYNRLHQLKSPLWHKIRQALNIDQSWVIVVNNKNFPQDKNQWIDIFYSEIDRTSNSSNCRLIKL